jgi:putative Holliday junction resolvase
MAWTDSLQISITPLATVETQLFDETFTSMIANNDISTVVFGLSAHGDGTLTYVGEKVEKLLNKYQVQFPSVEFATLDESFTSVRAKNLMLQLGVKKSKRRQKEKVDQMSAVIILKDFLNSRG